MMRFILFYCRRNKETLFLSSFPSPLLGENVGKVTFFFFIVKTQFAETDWDAANGTDERELLHHNVSASSRLRQQITAVYSQLHNEQNQLLNYFLCKK